MQGGPVIVCQFCGRTGHMASTCQELQRLHQPLLPAIATPPATPAPRFLGCFNCGDPLHWMKDCPFTRRPYESRPPPRAIEVTELPATALPANDVVVESKVIRARTVGRTLKLMFHTTDWAGDNQYHDCLVDTGSDRCLLPESLSRGACLRPPVMNLTTANGTALPVRG